MLYRQLTWLSKFWVASSVNFIYLFILFVIGWAERWRYIYVASCVTPPTRDDHYSECSVLGNVEQLFLMLRGAKCRKLRLISSAEQCCSTKLGLKHVIWGKVWEGRWGIISCLYCFFVFIAVLALRTCFVMLLRWFIWTWKCMTNMHRSGESLVQLITWNTKGMNSAVKRGRIWAHLKKWKADIAFLQETHLRSQDHVFLPLFFVPLPFPV